MCSILDYYGLASMPLASPVGALACHLHSQFSLLADVAVCLPQPNSVFCICLFLVYRPHRSNSHLIARFYCSCPSVVLIFIPVPYFHLIV